MLQISICAWALAVRHVAVAAAIAAAAAPPTTATAARVARIAMFGVPGGLARLVFFRRAGVVIFMCDHLLGDGIVRRFTGLGRGALVGLALSVPLAPAPASAPPTAPARLAVGFAGLCRFFGLGLALGFGLFLG